MPLFQTSIKDTSYGGKSALDRKGVSLLCFKPQAERMAATVHPQSFDTSARRAAYRFIRAFYERRKHLSKSTEKRPGP